jgi:hypothetical protein
VTKEKTRENKRKREIIRENKRYAMLVAVAEG